MTWWHRVGQRVVCVDDGPGVYDDGGWKPLLNQVYTIEEVDPRGFMLAEQPRPRLGGWRASRFRPVKDASIESLRALLTEPPDPALVREEADALTADALAKLEHERR